jgi:hypothetical protein
VGQLRNTQSFVYLVSTVDKDARFVTNLQLMTEVNMLTVLCIVGYLMKVYQLQRNKFRWSLNLRLRKQNLRCL